MDHAPYYRSRPEASTAILLIHGILGTPRHFDFLISSIPDEYQVHSLLLKGHGGSVSDFSRATMEQWRKQVRQAVIRLKRPGRRIILVGHSLGALLALEAATEHKCIHGLLLLNIPLIPFVRPSMAVRSVRFALGYVKDDPVDILCRQDLGTKLEPYLWKYIPWIPNFVSLLKLSRACGTIPPKLSIPCYVYLGEKDELVHISTRRLLLDNSHIHITALPNGRHFGYSQEEQEAILNGLKQLIGE